MNFGPCPYPDCDGELSMAIPEKTPAFTKTTCPICKRELWYKLSRLDPEAFTLGEFAERFEVDEATKMIAPRRSAAETSETPIYPDFANEEEAIAWLQAELEKATLGTLGGSSTRPPCNGDRLPSARIGESTEPPRDYLCRCDASLDATPRQKWIFKRSIVHVRAIGSVRLCKMEQTQSLRAYSNRLTGWSSNVRRRKRAKELAARKKRATKGTP